MQVFLFTDIEGSTRKWEEHREAMGQIISRHYTVLEDIPGGGGGVS
ncbi:MAG TPA: hypothetical protein VGJ84_09895 [Polyangiaceae bacterium]